MLCSNCGKDIPFTGKVCPFCKVDKSEDQRLQAFVVFFGFIGWMLGWYFIGFFKGFFVALVFMLIGFIIYLSTKKKENKTENNL